MKRMLLAWLVLPVWLVCCRCAMAERSEARYTLPTAHAISLCDFLSDEPVFGEDWARAALERKEYLPVYAAPDTQAYRGAGGRAEVCLSEPFSVLGHTQAGDWLLIEYETGKNARRIGYIQTPQDIDTGALDVRTLFLNPKELAVSQPTFLTDDPYHSQRMIAKLDEGERIACLGWTDAYYAYVSMDVGGKTAYGFVPMKALEMPGASRIREAEEMLRGVWTFIGGSEMFNYGIVMDGCGGFIDCSAAMELDGSLKGRYEVVPNDVPTDEFWNESAPYAFILRTDDGRVWRYVFDLLPADGVKRTQDKLMFYRGMGGGNFGRVRGEEAKALLREAERRLREAQ